MAREERIKLIQEIQQRRKAKLICYLTSDRQNASAIFAKDILPIFADHLNKSKYDKIDLLVFTMGGDTLAAFGLNRMLREYASTLNVLIPDKCHSAGTLFALGCNEILMTKTSSLGPIDPSTNDPLNPAVNINNQIQQLPLSVESVAGFKGLVKDDWGITKKADLASILKLLAEKVHPLALGKVYRSRQQIELLATTLLEQHRDDKNNIDNIVQQLTKKLGSHDHLIFRKEARKLLGNQIIVDDEMEKLIRNLYKDFVKEMELGKPFNPNLIISSLEQKKDKNGNILPRSYKITLNLAIVESEDRGNKCVREQVLTEVLLRNQQGIPTVAVQQEVKAEGWQEY